MGEGRWAKPHQGFWEKAAWRRGSRPAARRPNGLQGQSAPTPAYVPAMRYSFFPPTSRETPQMAEEGAV